MAEFAFAQHTVLDANSNTKNSFPLAEMELANQYRDLEGLNFDNSFSNLVANGAYNPVIQDHGLQKIFTSSSHGYGAKSALMNPEATAISGAGDGTGKTNSEKKKRKTTMVPTGSTGAADQLSSVENTSPKNNSGRVKRGKYAVNDATGGEVRKPNEVIHVRARRGQATDSHSLAERVRREKINERMRCLQDLVPGCYKTMGVATMLDEIINYVQSLQNQVEFLSMKLSAASSCFDFNMDATANEIPQMMSEDARLAWDDPVDAKEFQGGLLNYPVPFPL